MGLRRARGGTRRNGCGRPLAHGRVNGRGTGKQRRPQRHHTRFVVVFLRFFPDCGRSWGGGRGRRRHRGGGGNLLHEGGGRTRFRFGFRGTSRGGGFGVSLRFRCGDLSPRRRFVRGGKIASIITAQAVRQVVVDGAGMTELFGYAEFGKLVKNFSRLHFQLAGQLVYADLTHTEAVYFLPVSR